MLLEANNCVPNPNFNSDAQPQTSLNWITNNFDVVWATKPEDKPCCDDRDYQQAGNNNGRAA